MSALKTILYATDFSECSRAVFPLACALARADGARMIVLHVVPAAAPKGGFAPDLEPTTAFEEDCKSYHDEMAKRLSDLAPPDPRVKLERILKEGDAAEVILHTANETGSNLIVMGTHGRSGEFLRLMGSVAERVSRHAPCAVLTFRIGGDMTEPARACLLETAKEAF
jgi:nucleotide-binding universal stress UspA family protein